MTLPYETELAFAALSMLAQAQKHGGESTFAPRSQLLLQSLRTTLTNAGIYIEEITAIMLSGGTVDGDHIKIDPLRAEELASAFREAGLESSLPKG